MVLTCLPTSAATVLYTGQPLATGGALNNSGPPANPSSLTNSLVGYWNLDENGPDVDRADSVGGINLQAVSILDATNNGISAKHGNAIYSTNAFGYGFQYGLQARDGFRYAYTNTMTWHCWFYLPPALGFADNMAVLFNDQYSMVFNSDEGPYEGYWYVPTGDGQVRWPSDVGISPILTNGWHRLAMGYVNDPTQPYAWFKMDDATTLTNITPYLYDSGANGNVFDVMYGIGAVDELAYWTTNLNERQLSFLYNSGAGYYQADFNSYQTTNCPLGLSVTNLRFSAWAASSNCFVNTWCDWTAATTNSWIVFGALTNSLGSNTITIWVTDNSAAQARTGAVTVAGQTITVVQSNYVALTTLASMTNLPGVSLLCLPDQATTNASGYVTQFNDIGPMSYKLTNLAAGTIPSISNNWLNGHAIVRFDGVDDFLANESFSLAQPCEYVVVMRRNGPNSSTHAMIFDSGPARTAWQYATTYMTSSKDADDLTAGVSFSSSSVTEVSSNRWRVVSYALNGAGSVIFTNGVRKVTGNAGASSQKGLTLGMHYQRAAQPSAMSVALVMAFAKTNSAFEQSNIVWCVTNALGPMP